MNISSYEINWGPTTSLPSNIYRSNGKLSNVKHNKLHFKCVACGSEVRLVSRCRTWPLNFVSFIPCVIFYFIYSLRDILCKPLLGCRTIFCFFKGSKEKSWSGQWRLIWYQENMRWGQNWFRINLKSMNLPLPCLLCLV